MIVGCWTHALQDLKAAGIDAHQRSHMGTEIGLIAQIITHKPPHVPLGNELEDVTRGMRMKAGGQPAQIGCSQPLGSTRIVWNEVNTFRPHDDRLMDRSTVRIHGSRKWTKE
jgi:hypothetical protein